MEKYHHIRLAATALGLGVLVSPDSFVLLGNFMGHAGKAGLWILPAVLALFILIAPGRGGKGDDRPVLLTVKIVAAAFLSTGTLVSSGFVFNEVFVYWFPNFGFAFLLLALVLGIQLAGQTAVFRAQTGFAGLTLAALMALVAAGLAGGGPEGGGGDSGALLSLPGPGVMGLALLLWVGFDLAGSVQDQEHGTVPFIAAVAVAGLVFVFWGLVSILYVPLEKLADSGVPHMKAARYVLGETGRLLMGTAVISGTLAAVNALFLGCRHGVARLADRGDLPQWASKRFVVPVGLALAVGLMMATGLAGSETLELWIRAAFLLWLLGYAGRDRSVKGRLAGAVFIAGAGAVLFTGESPLLTSAYIGCILGTGLIFELISRKFSHH
jgi:hypothetical protein